MDTPTKVLLTGFEPFGNLTENPSQVIVETLQKTKLCGIELRCWILPVDFLVAPKMVTEMLNDETWQPDIVLHLGVADSRPTVTVERFAVNMMDSAKGDNAGFAPNEQTIIDNAPLSYRSAIPCKQLIAFLSDEGLPVKISNTAGTYVCNAVFYTSRHTIATNARPAQCGFVHLTSFDKICKKIQLKTIKSIILWLRKNQQQASLEYLFHGNV